MPGRARFLTRLGWALLTGLALVAALGAERLAGAGMPDAAGDLVAGLALVAGGVAAWARRPASRSGPLSLLAGVAWFAGDLTDVLLYAHRGPLVHLLLTYPSGRVDSRAGAVVIGAAYVDGLIPELARSEWPTIALMAAVVTVAAWRHRTVGGVERRARAAALAGAGMVGGTLALAASARLAGADLDTASTWGYYAVVALTAAGLSADLLWGRWTRAAVTGFVVDLGDRFEPDALRAALARSLGDADVVVAYRVAGVDDWVDEAGRVVRLPDADRRAVTLVHDEGEAVAALVHDPAALADRELVESVAAAARLAVVNVRLQAEIAARIGEVAASRRRVTERTVRRCANLRAISTPPELSCSDSRGAFTLAPSPKEASARPSTSWSRRPPFRSGSRCPRVAFRRRKRRPRSSSAPRASRTSPSTPGARARTSRCERRRPGLWCTWPTTAREAPTWRAARDCAGWPTASRRSAAHCAWTAARVPARGWRRCFRSRIGGRERGRPRRIVCALDPPIAGASLRSRGAVRCDSDGDRHRRRQPPRPRTCGRLRRGARRRACGRRTAGRGGARGTGVEAEAPLHRPARGRRHRLAPVRMEQSQLRPGFHSGARAVRGLAAAAPYDPLAQGCLDCPANHLLMTSDADTWHELGQLGLIGSAIWTAAFGVLTCVRLARFSPAGRRVA